MQLESYSTLNKVNLRGWSQFLMKHPEGTVFQSQDMFRLFESSKNYQPLLVMAMENKEIRGVLLAVIIREYSGPIGFFSLRTVVYGGPLIAEECQNREELLTGLVKELIRKVKNRSIFIQFRNFSDRKQDIPVYNHLGFKYMERMNYLVNTSSDELVIKRMSQSKLRQVKKGMSAGAELLKPETEAQVRAFYEILHDLYRNKVKKPLPDYSFFHNFYMQSKNPGLGIIRLVKYKDRIIGGILAPVFNNTTIYEWYVCGLDREYKHCYPSVLATWAAIDHALKNNIKTFDFMGVGIPGQEYGVREFKSKFGGELVNYGRFGRINNRFLYTVTEIGYNILSALKRI